MKIRKKGQGLPLNTVIIAILVLLVLVILAIFLYSSVFGTKQDINKTKSSFTDKCETPGSGRKCSDQPCTGISWGKGDEFSDCASNQYCCSG